MATETIGRVFAEATIESLKDRWVAEHGHRLAEMFDLYRTAVASRCQSHANTGSSARAPH